MKASTADVEAKWQKDARRAAARLRRLDLELGSRDVGCQAARTVRRWKTKGTEALDELGIHLAGAPQVFTLACSHRAVTAVKLPGGAKAWACVEHARQHEGGRRIRWMERSACLSFDAEHDSEEDFRKLWKHALATLPPDALAEHNAREIDKGDRAVRTWANRQRAARGEWPFSSGAQLSFDPVSLAAIRNTRTTVSSAGAPSDRDPATLPSHSDRPSSRLPLAGG